MIEEDRRWRTARSGAPALVVAASLLGAVGITWPLATVLGEATIRKPDAWPAAWQIDWLHHALLTDPLGWADANIFFPYQDSLATSDLLLTHALITLPAAASGSPVLGYNVALLLGVALCGLGTYLLVDEVTGRRWISAATGVLVAIAPFRFLHIEHLSVSVPWAVPFFFWALLRHLRRPSWKWACLAAGFGVAVPASSLYIGLFTLPLVPLVLLFGLRRGPGIRDTWVPLAAAATVGLALVAWLVLPFAETVYNWGIPWPDESQALYAADAVSLAAPPAFMGRPDRLADVSLEARLYPGTALAVLGLLAVGVAIVAGRRRGDLRRTVSVVLSLGAAAIAAGTVIPIGHPAHRPWAWAFVGAVWTVPVLLSIQAILSSGRSGHGSTDALRFGLAGTAVAMALALGPTVHFLGEPLGPGPYRLLTGLSSVYLGPRVTARFGGLVVLFLGLAAAGTLGYLASTRLGRGPLRPWSLGLCACLLLATTAYDLPARPWQTSRVPDLDLPEYRWLSGIEGDFGILELPEKVARWERGHYMLASRHHWKRLVNGTGGQLPPLQHFFFLLEPWSQEFFSYIRSYFPLRYVVVHAEGLSPAARRLLPRLATGHEGWNRAHREGETWIFTVDRSKEQGVEVERLYLLVPLAPVAEIEFRARTQGSVPEGTRVELLQNDQPVQSWPIDDSWRRHRLAVEVRAPATPTPWPRSTTRFTWRLVPERPDAELQLRELRVDQRDDGDGSALPR